MRNRELTRGLLKQSKYDTYMMVNFQLSGGDAELTTLVEILYRQKGSEKLGSGAEPEKPSSFVEFG